jgi:hypothetical protein
MGVAIFAVLFVCISAGVALCLYLDESSQDSLKCPDCASPVTDYLFTCPQCDRVLGRRRPPSHP